MHLLLLLLLLLLLSAAEVYQSSVEGTEENYQLRTTMSYLTTKLRQHDSNDQISTGTIAGLPAVCLKDTISEKDYTTYIYLEDGELKELFAASDLQADPMMGTSLTSMDSFDEGDRRRSVSDLAHRRLRTLRRPVFSRRRAGVNCAEHRHTDVNRADL